MSTTTLKRPTSPRNNPQGLLIVGIVIIVVAVLAIIAILLSGDSGTGQVNFATLPQSRTSDGGFVVGSPNAPITLIEFADFACSHCQEYHPIVVKYLQEYVATGKAKFEYRMVPTAGGQLSYYTGQLLECAENQKAGAFWKGYDLMYAYATSGRYTQDVGRLMANDLGLNYSALLTCAADAQQVQTDVNFSSQMGVTGTPATLVRYNDGPAQTIIYQGIPYGPGAAPFDVLSAITDAAQ